MGVLILNWFIGIYLIGITVLSLFLIDVWFKQPSVLLYIITFPIQIFRRNGRKKLFSAFKGKESR